MYKTFEDRLAAQAGAGDRLYEDAKKVCLEKGRVSTSLIQRHISTGYARSYAMIIAMENEGFCSKPDAEGRRSLLSDRSDSK